MTNLTKIPLQDGFKTTLSQSWDGNTGTMFVSKTPDFTFPSGVTTYVVVQPKGENAKLAEFDGYNAVNGTLNITNVTLLRGAGLNNPVGVSYPANTEVIISDNYQFWADIQTAINSKLDTDNAEPERFTGPTVADETARNALYPSPTGGEQVRVSSLGGVTQIYNSSTAQWETIGVATPPPLASETVAGLVEVSTNSEFNNGTDTGGTGAFAMPRNSQIKNALDNIVSHSTTDNTINDSDTLLFDDGDKKKITKANFRNQFNASETQKGFVEKATDEEAIAGTDTTRYISSDQIQKYLNKGYDEAISINGISSYWSGDTSGFDFLGTVVEHKNGFVGTISGPVLRNKNNTLYLGTTYQSLVYGLIDSVEVEFIVGRIENTDFFGMGDLRFNATSGTSVTPVVNGGASGSPVSVPNRYNTYKIIFDRVGSSAQFYVNGVLEDTLPYSPTLTSSVQGVRYGVTDTGSNSEMLDAVIRVNYV